MTEPPTLRRFVECMDTSIIIHKYNNHRSAAQGPSGHMPWVEWPGAVKNMIWEYRRRSAHVSNLFGIASAMAGYAANRRFDKLCHCGALAAAGSRPVFAGSIARGNDPDQLTVPWMVREEIDRTLGALPNIPDAPECLLQQRFLSDNPVALQR